MTETSTERTESLEDGGTMELVRTPAWEARYRLGQDPREFAHMFCCRDIDWGKAMCGYEDPDPTIMSEATESICTMCVEAGGGPDGPMATRDCPVDNQPCPDDETMDRMIAERTSRP